MEQAFKEIAPRLAGLRDALDWDVDTMAREVGATVEEVARYESGAEEIPLGYLLQVSRATGVDMSTLIADSESHLTAHSLVRSGKGLSVDRRKDYDYRSLAYRFKGRRMEPFIITVPPKKADEVNLTQHAGQEFIHLLEGRMELTLGKTVEVLEPGDSLYFDSQTPHGMRALDGKPARFLDVIL